MGAINLQNVNETIGWERGLVSHAQFAGPALLGKPAVAPSRHLALLPSLSRNKLVQVQQRAGDGGPRGGGGSIDAVGQLAKV